jgi:hypothetical protein
MWRISVRKMMLVVAGVAIALATVAKLEMRPTPDGARPQCASNISKLAYGLRAFLDHNGGFPSGTWPNSSLPPAVRLSWYMAILPYIEQNDVYQEIDKTVGWNSPPNATCSHQRPYLLHCPAIDLVSLPQTPATNYIGSAGTGKDAPDLPKGDPRCGVFGFDRRTTLADITDGAANTLMIVESGAATGSWLQGGFATVRGLDPANLPYLGLNRQFGGLHQGGAWIATADGAVRWARDSIDPRVFEALSTIAGGEKWTGSDDAFRE